MSEPLTGDDGRPWGFIDVDGVWIELPKGPGLIDMGPPPFDVELYDGRVRHVVHKPEATNEPK